MNKFTIQQLQQMRESEDRVEFKAGDGGNVSYDGRGKINPNDRRRCILGYVIALCNEGGGRLVLGMHDNYPHRVTGTRQAQDACVCSVCHIFRLFILINTKIAQGWKQNTIFAHSIFFTLPD